MKASFATLGLTCAVILLPCFSRAQTPDPGTRWRYQLLEGSLITDDCPICDRMPIIQPLRGSFELKALGQGPLFSYYAIENIFFTNVSNGGPTYTITGTGTYQIGGEIAVSQSLQLELWIDNRVLVKQCFFTNTSSMVTRHWPMFQISVNQTNGTPTQQLSLDLNAAPMRELWFSTAQDFLAGIWNSPSNLVSNGDFLSSEGRRVKTNQELTARLGIMPPAPDLGLKDIDILPGGEIAFSLRTDVFSETLRHNLSHGDLLSNRGLVLRTNSDLIAAFAPQNVPATGVGLAAVQLRPGDETWFSAQTEFTSQKLKATITPGDLLSDNGSIIRSNAQLLGRFNPVGLTNYVPLQAVYVWPSGEIWFCAGSGFDGANGMRYEAGDLLSDQGYLVWRNAELLSSFAPEPAGTNVTLDALYVITDTFPSSPPAVLEAPQITNHPPSSLAVSWRSQARVFQLESATNIAGPFSPVTPIIPDSTATDAGTLQDSPHKFYRVRQW
jgi:hypothetical protein